MRDPPPGGNPFVPSAYDLFTQGDMDAWTADLLAKTQRVLKGRDPWAAPPRPPSPLRAETPPAPLYAEEYEGKYEDEEEEDDDDDEEEEEEELFGGVTPHPQYPSEPQQYAEQYYEEEAKEGYAEPNGAHVHGEDDDELEEDDYDSRSASDNSVVVIGDSDDDDDDDERAEVRAPSTEEGGYDDDDEEEEEGEYDDENGSYDDEEDDEEEEEPAVTSNPSAPQPQPRYQPYQLQVPSPAPHRAYEEGLSGSPRMPIEIGSSSEDEEEEEEPVEGAHYKDDRDDDEEDVEDEDEDEEGEETDEGMEVDDDRSDGDVQLIDDRSDGEGDELDDEEAPLAPYYEDAPAAPTAPYYQDVRAPLYQPMAVDDDAEEEGRSPTPPPVWQHSAADFGFMQPGFGLDAAQGVHESLIEAVISQLPQQDLFPTAFPAAPSAVHTDGIHFDAAPSGLTSLGAAPADTLPVDSFPMDPALIDPSLDSVPLVVDPIPAAEASSMPAQAEFHSSATFIAGEFGATYFTESSMSTNYQYDPPSYEFTEVFDFEAGPAAVQADEIESPMVRGLPMLRGESAMTQIAHETVPRVPSTSGEDDVDITFDLAEEAEQPPPATADDASDKEPSVSEEPIEVEQDEEAAARDSEEDSEEIDLAEDEPREPIEVKLVEDERGSAEEEEVELVDEQSADEEEEVELLDESGDEEEEVELLEEKSADEAREEGTREPTQELRVYFGEDHERSQAPLTTAKSPQEATSEPMVVDADESDEESEPIEAPAASLAVEAQTLDADKDALFPQGEVQAGDPEPETTAAALDAGPYSVNGVEAAATLAPPQGGDTEFSPAASEVDTTPAAGEKAEEADDAVEQEPEAEVWAPAERLEALVVEPETPVTEDERSTSPAVQQDHPTTIVDNEETLELEDLPKEEMLGAEGDDGVEDEKDERDEKDEEVKEAEDEEAEDEDEEDEVVDLQPPAEVAAPSDDDAEAPAEAVPDVSAPTFPAAEEPIAQSIAQPDDSSFPDAQVEPASHTPPAEDTDSDDAAAADDSMAVDDDDESDEPLVVADHGDEANIYKEAAGEDRSGHLKVDDLGEPERSPTPLPPRNPTPPPREPSPPRPQLYHSHASRRISPPQRSPSLPAVAAPAPPTSAPGPSSRSSTTSTSPPPVAAPAAEAPTAEPSTADSVAPVPLTVSQRRDRRQSQRQFSPPRTRSKCGFEKVRFQAQGDDGQEYWAIILVPHCVAASEKLKAEKGQALGTADDADLCRVRPQDIVRLKPELFVKLSRAIGLELVEDGHSCGVLDAGDGSIELERLAGRHSSVIRTRNTPDPTASGEVGNHLTPPINPRMRRGSSTGRSTRATPQGPTPSPVKRSFGLEPAADTPHTFRLRSAPNSAQHADEATSTTNTSPLARFTRAMEAAENDAAEDEYAEEANTEAGPSNPPNALGLEASPAASTRSLKRKAELLGQDDGDAEASLSVGHTAKRLAHAMQGDDGAARADEPATDAGALAGPVELISTPVATRTRKRKASEASQTEASSSTAPESKRRTRSETAKDKEEDAQPAGRRGYLSGLSRWLPKFGGRQ